MAGSVDRVIRHLESYTLVWVGSLVLVVGVVRAVEVGIVLQYPISTLVVSPVLALLAGGAVLWQGELSFPSSRLGVDDRRLFRATASGLGGVLAVQVGAVGIQSGVLAVFGAAPTVVVEAVDPVTGGTDTQTVLLALVAGVLVTAVGEELLFRGALLGALRERYAFPAATTIQATCFGLWHLAWPLALVLAGVSLPIPLPVHALGFVVVTGFVGGVYAVLARATGTLWTAVLAHLVHNTTAVFLHVRAGGADRARALSATLVLGYAALAGLVWWRFER